jgi:hypothetical protein
MADPNNQNSNPYQSNNSYQNNTPYQTQQSSPEMISSQNNYTNNQVNPYQSQAPTPVTPLPIPVTPGHTKFCKFCGSIIPFDAVVCTSCGRQVEELKTSGGSEKIIVNNVNSNTNSNINTAPRPVYYGREKNKWVAFLLCLFFGVIGAHKFYEGKILFGFVYLFTFGFGGLGVFIDLILILLKPNPYYV